MKYLAFDIEIAKELPEGEIDWKDHRPLGITCAAAYSSDGGLWNWWAHDERGKFTPAMTGEQCAQMVNDLGYMVDVCKYDLLTWNGLGFDFDILGEEGALAPALWSQGEYHKVLDYVSWDVKNTLALAQVVEKKERLDWISNSGRPNSWQCQGWLQAKEAMKLVEPDTSWMTNPWPREKFYKWTVNE
jgi:hypothetical protein